GGLETDARAFVVDLLEGGLFAVLQPDGDHVAVVPGAGLLHEHEVTVVDQGVDHGCALDAQGEDVLLAARHLVRDVDAFFEVLGAPGVGGGDGDGLTGGDLTDNRDAVHAG